MKVLLDTHVFLWAIGDPRKLSSRARSIISDERNQILLSAASLWEIALKIRTGKLQMPEDAKFFMTHLIAIGATTLPVQVHHVFRLFLLPSHHGDPFDRILVAQSQAERARLLTADPLLRKYEADIVW